MPTAYRRALGAILAVGVTIGFALPTFAKGHPGRRAAQPPNPPLYATRAYQGSQHLKHFEGLAKAHPKSLVDQFEAGVAAFQNHLPQASIRYYSACLRLDSHFGQAANDIGNVYVELLKSPAKAVRYYQEAIRLSPKYLVAYLQLANAYTDMGKPALAVNAYKAALKVAPSFTIADYYVATEYQTALKNPKLAIIYYKRTLKLQRNFDSAWLGLVQTYGQMKDTAEMRATAREALKVLPKNDPLRPQLAKLAK